MKTIEQITAAILIITAIGLSTSCSKNPFKKDLDETLIEHKWKVTEWMSYPGRVEPTPYEDLYTRFYDEDCKRDSYEEYIKDGTISFHNSCYDTITNNVKWAVEGNEKLILTYPLWNSDLQEYEGDSVQTWEVLDYSRKKIELKMKYVHYGDGGAEPINYTETKTLESFK